MNLLRHRKSVQTRNFYPLLFSVYFLYYYYDTVCVQSHAFKVDNTFAGGLLYRACVSLL